MLGLTVGHGFADATKRMSGLCLNCVHLSPESSVSGIQDVAWHIFKLMDLKSSMAAVRPVT